MKKELLLILVALIVIISGCNNSVKIETNNDNKGPVNGNSENPDCDNECNNEGDYCSGNKLYECIKSEDGCFKSTLVDTCSNTERCTSDGCVEKKTYKLSDKFDLRDYPEPFIKNDKFNDYALIVSTNGLNGEIIVGADIQDGLADYVDVDEKFPSPLVTRQIDNVDGKNAILIGSPCTNQLIAEVKNIEYESETCADFINDGETIVELYDNTDDAHVILLVMAKDNNDYKKAGLFLKRWEEHANEFKGNKVIIK